MAYTDISSFLMAYAKSRYFALGFLSSLCIQRSRAGPMPLRKPHSASVFFDLTMQYDRCPVIHKFRSVFVDKMISDYQSGSLRIVYLIKIKRFNYVVPCFTPRSYYLPWMRHHTSRADYVVPCFRSTVIQDNTNRCHVGNT